MQTGSIEKYDYIDALRGIAIVGVVAVHTSQWIVPESGVLGLIAKQGARGVQLFFLASALTLFMSMEARKGHEPQPVVSFFVRRFFRIAPLFYFGIIIYTLYSGMEARYWAPDGLRWWHIALTATFLHGWHPDTITSVVPGGWSIAVEMTFYLCVPFLYRQLKDVRSTLLALLGSLLLARVLGRLTTIAITSLYPEDQQYLVSSFTFLWFFSQLPIFILGILTFHIVRAYRRSDEVLSAALLLVSFFLAAAFLKISTFQGLLPQHFLYGIAFVVFATSLHFYPNSIFVNRLTQLIGRYSFSIYIVHFMVLNVLKEVFAEGFPVSGDLGFLMAFALALSVAVAVSSLTYHAVESPGIDLGKRVIATMRQQQERGAARVQAL